MGRARGAREGSSVALRLTRFKRRLADRATAFALHVVAKVLPALPTRAALGLSDVLGTLGWALDRRGRRCGTQGLGVVFGDEMTRRERARVLRASYRNAIRNEVLLFHLQPLDLERYRRFVRVDPDDDARFRRLVEAHPSFVLVSGHLGNWELLLAARAVLPYAPPMAYLAESTGRPTVDRLFERLRDHGSGGAARRKGGAMALRKAMEQGQSVCLLVDRNVTRFNGGRFVPFLGIPARTTPLPAMLAHRYRVPLSVALLLPDGPARWRLWISDDLAEPRTGDEAADVYAAMRRMNDALSGAVRQHPEAWAWMLKRWKSRPTTDLGPYPAYSVFDPDESPRG
jgi:lauroyl/myristoyl acyltransferase